MVSTTELFAGRFRLGPLLGQGGMSDVYRAVDSASGDSVAVKIVRSGDPELARRLAQEVKVHQRMVHEGLIRLLDTGVADGQAYIVMELVDGATLAASLRSKPLGPRLTAKLGGILGGALAYVHAEGVVHRDVKPSNILLGADGRALLGDFGVARLVDATTFTIDGTTIGTVAYMAPEQLEDHSVGPEADIWSLGMVLLECLTGRRVYEGTSSEIIARRLAGPVPLPADLPVPWKLLLSGMLDHRPQQRLNGAQVSALLSSDVFSVPWSPSPVRDDERGLATVPLDLTALAPGDPLAGGANGHGGTTAVNVASDVNDVHEATQVGAPPVSPVPRRQRRRSRRRGWAIALAVAALLTAGGSVAYALTSQSSPHSPRVPPGTTNHASTTTTSTSTTTTTTTLPSAPVALASLVRDVASGVTNGSISSGIGQALTNLAQKAATDGSPDLTTRDLQEAAVLIANGVQNGVIQPAEASTLQNDLSVLAGSLGLSAAGAVPSTTSTTSTTTGNNSGKGRHGGDGGGP
jgi:serine/threonine protein kinase